MIHWPNHSEIQPQTFDITSSCQTTSAIIAMKIGFTRAVCCSNANELRLRRQHQCKLAQTTTNCASIEGPFKHRQYFSLVCHQRRFNIDYIADAPQSGTPIIVHLNCWQHLEQFANFALCLRPEKAPKVGGT